MQLEPDKQKAPASASQPFARGNTLPAISLPKGGGAIRGIGEKFATNPVTGTGSLSVPIATSPGRIGFGPKLSLTYDSGAGNGPFGLGWNLTLPAITRKTDKGLPKYDDSQPDVFLLSGAEDLVPQLKQLPDGQWVKEPPSHRSVDHHTFLVSGFRPRIEGLFARIEHWTSREDPKDNFWRSISRDNITTWYGRTSESRIYDPNDRTHVFSWLICESYDDKGNVISYRYKEENSEGVLTDLAHERNRTPESRAVNRHLKRIRYGNRSPYFPELLAGRPVEPLPADDQWHFEVVFDYGEHDVSAPTPKGAPQQWSCRQDPFSTYRAGFESRTYRLCRRVLMFHHFEDEPEVGRDCLVRSTDFTYSFDKSPTDPQNPIHSVLLAVVQSGYKRQDQGYVKRSLPSLVFEYSKATIDETVRSLDAESLENLPVGLDGGWYRWVDLDGEGLSGILTEQADSWFYKRNLSPIDTVQENGEKLTRARFAMLEQVAVKPSLAELANGRQQLIDLAGDGQLDLVELNSLTPGFYERTADERWESFKEFKSLPNVDWNDPNLRFVDLTGDGHADVLITEDNVFSWFPSLAEEGFGPEERISQGFDEERGPRVIFADAEHSVHLADLSGDGLVDLVRIRNGEVCYWPNLGYGRFGAKVTMDRAPWFDKADQFDPKRLQLADIDGSGVTDLIYLASDGVRIYFNQSGNSWSDANLLTTLPPLDNVVAISAFDLLGIGTACLVWSSPLPADARSPICYVNLMRDGKPHLLTRTINNLGAETEVAYAPSTTFYLNDKQAGKPWITRIPFPVHVVERVTTVDQISSDRFFTRYAYHHGYFDGIEREFRGFGMVEQWDTEERSAGAASTGNIEDSDLPPVHTKTWFHTGVYVDRDRISNFFARNGEYYREPGLTDEQARASLLPDTVLPGDLSVDEEREACRALKGSMLRQEIFAIDETSTQEYPSGHPYTVIEQNFSVTRLQPQADNKHSVFFTHPRESISNHYERNPADPRRTHAFTLELDQYGNVRKELAVAYGRSQSSLTETADIASQTTPLITYTEHDVTNAIDDPDALRTPLPAEVRTYELTGFAPRNAAARFSFDEFASSNFERISAVGLIPYRQKPNRAVEQKRLIERVRSLYRGDDLEPLPLRGIGAQALPWKTLKLALTPELIADVFKRTIEDAPEVEDLLPDPGTLLEGHGPDQGGYESDEDGNWWIPSGRAFFYPQANIALPEQTAPTELLTARSHFYLPRMVADPFDQPAFVDYDVHDLLVVRGKDVLDNTTEVVNDYRVLQPRVITDANGNTSEVLFDALGLVAATALKGKNAEGDLLEQLNGDPLTVDPLLTEVQAFIADPEGRAGEFIGKATTRIVYDLERFSRCGQPPFGATLNREQHFNSEGGPQSPIQISFSYSDGFGREIQKRIQAEAGDAPERAAATVSLATGDTAPGELRHGPDGKVIRANIERRWVGTGRTVYNNKGKPVRQYEPFFSATHLYEPEREMTDTGVSSMLLYDPVERVVATLHPNHTYEKVVFDAWSQSNYDVNDTVSTSSSADRDVQSFVIRADGRERIPVSQYSPTWFELRTKPEHLGERERLWPDARLRNAEQDAAAKAQLHADTPSIAHLDPLGRTFLTFADNGPDPNSPAQHQRFATRITIDIEGNQREVRDAVIDTPHGAGDQLGRAVMRYDYDMLGNRIHQSSMEAGEHWMLNDATGKTIRSWDGRGFERRLSYDELRRPTELLVTENGSKRVAEQTVYGEGQGSAGNHLTRVYQLKDGAGVATTVKYDFKGNATDSRRDLMGNYRDDINWGPNPIPDGFSFTSSTEYDALNRPIVAVSPDKSIYRPTFNRANLLDKVHVCLRGETDANKVLKWTPFVTNIDYNEKGQRKLIAYQNGAQTSYEYDELTFRLIHLKTTRPAGRNGNSSQLFADATVVQDLFYTFDPVGNITRLEDAALKPVPRNGEDLRAICQYKYDALYRLIEATGREHVSQSAVAFNPPDQNYRDFQFAGHGAHPNDLQALRGYTETYVYDPVGNFESVSHVAANGNWTRTYFYEAKSQIEENKKSNRLTRTEVGNGSNQRDDFTHDAQGNITSMPHLSQMTWDFEDQLQQLDLGGGGTAYYVYDAGGQRVRKVIESQNGVPRSERIYLGGFEVYREYNGNYPAAKLERETLHVMDDKQRIALVETRTIKDENEIADPVPLQRHQLGNHLRSASVELSADGSFISYEEFHPYGTTAFQVNGDSTEVSLKRYRYTGKERDDESGFYYHGARYYAAWLGRWVNCDPDVRSQGKNLFVFSFASPTVFVDSNGRFPMIWNETHETITNEAFDRVMLDRKNTSSLKKFRTGVIEGVQYSDVPEGLSKLQEVTNAEKTGTTSRVKTSVTYRSHYGDLQIWHSMSPKEIKSAQELKATILAQGSTWYDQAKAESDQKKSGKIIGQVLHMVQDSWSPAHVERDKAGKVLGFQAYDKQDPDKHTKAEVPENVDEESWKSVSVGVPGAPQAAKVSELLLRAFLNDDKGTFMHVLEQNYQLDPNAYVNASRKDLEKASSKDEGVRSESVQHMKRVEFGPKL